jgi:exodeoxyribonuclease V alpha subunit
MGLLLPLDLLFAERMLKKQSDVCEEHVAFLALLLALSRQGHLALPLQDIDCILRMLPAAKACDVSPLAEMARQAVLTLPLLDCIYVQNGIFYLQKNGMCESSIAHQILRLLNRPGTMIETNLALVEPLLNKEQKEAVRKALEYPLSLLSGGPGTGKTYTAVQLIKTFLESYPKARVILTAPTGKAVAQLDAYLKRLFENEARMRSGTLHALLGVKRERDFDRSPLPLFADLVLVDECSMIDARLFERLLSSIRGNTHLILIGDPDQLPPVEAGSIFGDLVALTRTNFPLPCTELKECLRSDRAELMHFARAIRKGDAADVRQTLTEHGEQSIKWIDLPSQAQQRVYSFLWNSLAMRFSPFLFKEEGQAEDLLRHLDAFRLLSCIRQGPFGVDAINQFFAQKFLQAAQAHPSALWWALPILITHNDYALELFNGDTGVLLRKLCSKETHPEDHALFYDRKQKDRIRRIPAIGLPKFEWSYCLSVHKSQGSEYDEVFILIPNGSEFFGREILYTAVTRARHSVSCAGSLDVIEKTVQNSARKISGLSATLALRTLF